MSDKLDGEGSPKKPPRGASGVSASEKYAELQSLGEDRPIGPNGFPMRWNRSTKKRLGGFWAKGGNGSPCCRRIRINETGRPECVHGPMTAKGGERFVCGENERRLKRVLRAKFIAQGICTNCMQRPLATADGWRCNFCLDRRITPEALLKNRRTLALRSLAKRTTHHQTEGGIKLG